MCGIAGSVNVEISTKILQQIYHRGPDYQDLKVFNKGDDTLYLGHTRLSILDLSPAGNQPMFSDCGNYVIVFNGEIYNHSELRKKLWQTNFNGHSDTETILYYIKENGIESIKDFNGIFAFGFLDLKAGKLFIVRDRYGVKPVYYHYNNKCFIFSSELKLILSAGVQKSIDQSSLETILNLRYNLSPNTIFKNIYKLKAAHYIEYNLLKHEISEFKYWKKEFNLDTKITINQAVEKYQFLIEQAVKRQLMADVPVGLFLSGGVDSALLGTIMTNQSGYPINTYTVGFKGEGNYNELMDARISSNHMNSVHHEEWIEQEEYLSYFRKSFYHTEEPIAEATIPALYHVSKMCAEKNKVVLSGQGADEPLAGYNRYRGVKLISKYAWLIKLLPYNLIKQIFPNNESYQRGIYSAQFTDELDRFVGIYNLLTPDLKNGLFRKSSNEIKAVNIRKNFEEFYAEIAGKSDSLNRILYLDTRTMLSDNLLLFNDKITMAHSIEDRVPFLDNDLVDFIETLPSHMKLNGTSRKYLEKMAAKKWLPVSIINRKKRGFETPIDKWFKESLLIDEMTDLITGTNSISRQYLNVDFILKMLQLHKNGKRNFKKQLFTIYSLELWFKEFYEKY